MTISRYVYVISDLHLGGAAPAAPGEASPATAEGRGFRMFTQGPALAAFISGLAGRPATPRTELVINGDFVDFLAEEQPGGGFSPFTADPHLAAEKFAAIAGREAAVFAALSAFLAAGHRLTLLIGNHDLELSLPAVRRRLEALIDPDGGGDFRYIYDGEAYIVGDALIEHGNRYDGFNIVDHDALRQTRSLQSRRQAAPADGDAFAAPPGSQLVTRVMNPIKRDYPFVDLLKPETEAVVPILLALEPGLRAHLGAVARLAVTAARHQPQGALPATPVFRGDIAAGSRSWGGDTAATRGPGNEDAALRQVLGEVLPAGEADAFLRQLDLTPAPAYRGDIAAGAGPVYRGASDATRSVGLDRVFGVLQLLVASKKNDLERRLPALRRALRVLKDRQHFDRVSEPEAPYLRAARRLADDGGFRFVVFGHTHLARRIPLTPGPGGAERLYLNSGTWADLMQLPQELLVDDEEQGLAALRDFLPRLRDPSAWVTFAPTYVRLEVHGDADSERVAQAELRDFQGEAEL